ncbi:DUF4079 domain-containing protein [Kamptonema animale CS-326]|jgi:drug/metabolite transporter (DMT)-like permease|uniref:DUF4079 domain-containing protein n=1 Tax=Kamptonema animale TaxID=92934 RepID=UPI00233154A8|nr:DUF4079 domain-containing protein [Kamptonema animale]MDB9510292.1 DUF4079 domain-containing protein [Kamptonema animale CS-326]
MELVDVMALLHPALAVAVVFPIIGMVVNMAWQTRSRRLQSAGDGKSKIPPSVGSEHVKLGRWLTGSVVGVSLVAFAYVIFFNSILKNQLWSKAPFQVVFIVLMFVATIASLVFLYKATLPKWRAIFATLSSAGLIIIAFQDGIFRRDDQWMFSHFYYGLLAAILMIVSLAIVPEIYKDRTNKWRKIHTILNCVALLLFIGQGMTGSRDLLEIPLSWQQEHLYQCDWNNKTCPKSSSSIGMKN